MLIRLIFFCLMLSGCTSISSINSLDFEKSCEKDGYASEQFNKGYSYAHGQNMPKDRAKAMLWYRKSAEQCYAPAEFMLGLAYEKGDGVVKNEVEAFRWYQKAFEHGFDDASKKLRKRIINTKLELKTSKLHPLDAFSKPMLLASDKYEFSQSKKEKLIEVFYGTDRAINDSTEPKNFFGSKRGNLVFGTCKVSIPINHKMGEVESPYWLHRENTEQHVVLRNVTPYSEEDFFSSLSSKIKTSKGKQALVFVHGYNVSFADAARRTAQLSNDLGFDGAPVFFSWPSQNKEDIISYITDETSEEWSVPHLKSFLKDVSKRTGAETIFLIAHSMGTRALSSALREIASEKPSKKMFKEIVLAAPDIDAEVFQRDIIPKIRPITSRITLYVSSEDKALQLSKGFHGYPRAGESGINNLVIASGLDTIDATSVDTSFIGHSYFANNRSVISDIQELLINALPPDKRNLMVKRYKGLKYWAFKP